MNQGLRCLIPDARCLMPVPRGFARCWPLAAGRPPLAARRWPLTVEAPHYRSLECLISLRNETPALSEMRQDRPDAEPHG